MKVLVYRWGSISELAFCEALRTLQIEFIELRKEIKNYHADAAFAGEMIKLIQRENPTVVFSYDYFPIISMLCEINKIPYVAWIYDCPQYTLMSKTLMSSYNYIFCFDRKYMEQLQAWGAKNCIHYPLAGNSKMLELAAKKNDGVAERYVCDISFLGNLYNGEKNRLRQAQLTPYVAGYVDALVQAQSVLYGCNVLKEALREEPMVTDELIQKCALHLGTEYVQDELQLAADVVGMEVSAKEREEVLKCLSEYYPVKLYTSSKLPGTLKKGLLEVMGYADYETQMPWIFKQSKINLNVTSKTIETGIPQRVFDILSCGGFCLTNYQEEIAEVFEDGKELVMYDCMEDLLNKVSYYLEHEQERKQIAECGYQKIVEKYDLVERVRDMFIHYLQFE